MRILLITQWFHPENNIRANVLASALVKRGHEVQVVTGYPNYPLGRIYDGYRQRPWTREEWQGVQLLRFPLYPDHSESPFRRSLTYLSFALSTTLLSPFLARRADIAWVYHPPLTIGLTALTLRTFRRIPFVFEIQDMWPEMITSSGMVSSKRVIGMLSGLAKLVYRGAAAISVISEGFKRNLVDKGVPEEKINVLPNWGDEATYEVCERESSIGEQHALTGYFNVMYAGNMGPAQDLHILLQAAGRLKEYSHIQFVLVGGGLSLEALRAQAAAEGLRNVLFIGRQPPKAMPALLAWGDALLVQLRDEDLFKMTIPSKILAYMGSGRPILCAVGGDAEQIVRETGAGITCRPGDPEALARTVSRMSQLDASELERMGKAGRQAFQERFSQDVLVDQYEQLFKSTLDAGSRLLRRK